MGTLTFMATEEKVNVDLHQELGQEMSPQRAQGAIIKKIHYCWFGAEEPEIVKKNVARWREMNPDYEIIKWDESNTDVNQYEYGRRALASKKWAFVSDIVRLQKLIEQGGFYMDTDVELIRPLDELAISRDKLVIGYMLDCALGTAVIYSPPGHPYLCDMLKKYNHIRKNFRLLNNSMFTEYFINEVPGFLLNGKQFENENSVIYPKEYFEQPAFIRSKGISIHHACGSWNKSNPDAMAFSSNAAPLQHFIMWGKRQYRAYKMLQDNEFIDCYKAALKGEHLAFNTDRYYEPQE